MRRQSGRRRILALTLFAAILGIAVVANGGIAGLTGQRSGTDLGGGGSPLAGGGGSAALAAGSSPSAAASAPAAPRSAAGASPSPFAVLGAAVVGSARPKEPAGFKPTDTVVPMGLPFLPGTQFTFGDGWRAARVGAVEPYNQIRGVSASGVLLRAHDGVDLRVPIGTIVVAPFAGVVVDPRPLWRPWEPSRYGKVVVIRSTEPASAGYMVIMAHLSRQSVAIGAIVRRGQVVGRTGITGDAAGTIPHLHIEIHAPFLIRYGFGGVIRWLDDFDITPSIRAAMAPA